MPRKPPAPTPLAEGRAFFKGRRGHSVRVVVLQNRSAARRWAVAEVGSAPPKDAVASFYRYGRNTTSELGIILLSLSHSCPDTIAHEATHAVLEWARRKRVAPGVLTRAYVEQGSGIEPIDGPEETLAYALGGVVGQMHAIVERARGAA